MMKVPQQTVLAIIVLFSIFSLLPRHIYAQPTQIGIKTVVIDAGHGGKDPGAVYRNFREKDINLAVALKFGELINKHYPYVNVIYTRKTDVFVELYKRADIANKAGADLFISIHINAAKSASAAGTETIVMGIDKSGSNLDMAMRENDVITLEEDYSANYQGYVPGSPESFIIFSLMQYAYQGQSLTLADMVQKRFSSATAMPNRGVKQAGILVLWNTAMSSVLTEFGFLSNPTEAAYIHSAKGRDTYAQCLFNAFSEYKAGVERQDTRVIVGNGETNSAPAATSTTTATTAAPARTTTAAATSSNTGNAPPRQTANLVYKVQVASSPKKIPKNSSAFSIYRGEVEEKIINNIYKYYLGGTSSYEEALSLQSTVRKNIGDAFVVAFLNGQQISVSEAKNLK